MKTLLNLRPGLFPVALLALLGVASLALAADETPAAATAAAATATNTAAAEAATAPTKAPAEAVDDESTPADESLSPSQISADRINAIRQNEYFYQSYGKEDPFTVLVSGSYEQTEAADQVDVNSAKLVGVMWGQDDRFALVEDGDGFGYILRVGDPVRNGRVVSIRKSALTAQVTLYGITSNVVLKLDNLEE